MIVVEPPRLALLLPADVVTAECLVQVDEGGLYPEEAAHVARAVPKRRREFAAGRACARRALAALGVARVPIPVARDRSPVWPDGIVGSISHTSDYGAAAVAFAEDFDGIGIDVEGIEPLKPELWRLILTPDERARIDDGVDAKVVFSIKEAVYKCQYAQTRTMLDFGDVEVRLGDGAFAAVIGAGPARGTTMTGRFARDAGWVFSACARRRSD